MLMLLCAAFISVFYSTYEIHIGRYDYEFSTRDYILPYYVNIYDTVPVPDKENHDFRVDVYRGMLNTGMSLGYPTIHAFHSIVPQPITDFYGSLGIWRDVGSEPNTSHYPLRSVLSVRWVFEPAFAESQFGSEYRGAAMPGYRFAGQEGGFYVWENENFIPLGFSYDYCITPEDFSYLDNSDTNPLRDFMLLKAMVLDEEQMDTYRDVITPFSDWETLDFSYEAFSYDCIERNWQACYSFVRDNRGFTAKSHFDRDSLVFFSVPWEDGWSAAVNGEATPIEYVNNGFMAVRVSAGESEIRFDYMTPGLKTGLFITVLAFLSYAGYLIVIKKWVDKRKKL